MIRFLIYSLLIPYLFLEVKAQGWEKIYNLSGDQYVNHIEQTQDNGFIVGGNGTLKIDANGIEDWSVAGGSLFTITQMTNGEYMQVYSGWQPEIYVSKRDTNGVLVWNKTFTLSQLGGNVAAVGYVNWVTAYPIIEVEPNICLVATANSIMENTFLNPYQDQTLYNKFNDQGNIITKKTGTAMSGYTITYNIKKIDATTYSLLIYNAYGSASAFRILDKNGTVLKNVTSPGGWFGNQSDGDHCSTADNGFVVLSQSSSKNNMYLSKADANGAFLWSKNFGTANSKGRAVEMTPDGGFIVAGYTTGLGAGKRDAYLVRLDADANVLWETTYGGAENDEAFDVTITSDGCYVLGGFTESFGAMGKDFYIIKTDSGCGITSIRENISLYDNKVLIYPNPMSTQTKLIIQGNYRNGEIKLYDLAGREQEISYSINRNELILPRGNLPSGIYFFAVTNGTQTYTGKLAVQ